MLVEADAQLAGGGTHGWFNLDALNDPPGAQLYRELLERVWPLGDPPPEVGVAEYRALVEYLDAVPPGVQVEIGRKMLELRQRLARTGKWQSSSVFVDKERLLVLACDDLANQGELLAFDAELALLAAVRAHETAEQVDRVVPVLAVGHLVDPTGIDYRYLFQDPPVDVSADLRAGIEVRRGLLDVVSRTVVQVSD